ASETLSTARTDPKNFDTLSRSIALIHASVLKGPANALDRRICMRKHKKAWPPKWQFRIADMAHHEL
ncbi:MAG: hypothetical protein AB7S92_18545, partial [Parvibaculaceae bacterium]